MRRINIDGIFTSSTDFKHFHGNRVGAQNINCYKRLFTQLTNKKFDSQSNFCCSLNIFNNEGSMMTFAVFMNNNLRWHSSHCWASLRLVVALNAPGAHSRREAASESARRLLAH